MSGQTTQFVYDGDGNLVKKIKPDGSKTIYVGGIYEVDKTSGGTVTKTTVYYPLAGAMRVNGTLYYVLKDHLGSASVVTDASGNVVGDQRYYPFGETRVTTGTMYTDKLFTSQREITGLGIYHYGARFYSPKLGRFLSADTIVPNPANPQDFNRYSYVRNNPLRYTDSTGHGVDCGIGMGCVSQPGNPAGIAPGTPPRPPCTRNCGDDDVTLDDQGDVVSGQITAGELDNIAEEMTSDLLVDGGLNDQAQSNINTINTTNAIVGIAVGAWVCLGTAGWGCAILAGTALFGESILVNNVAVGLNSNEELEDTILYFNAAANLANDPNQELIFIVDTSAPGGDAYITITGMQEPLVIEGGIVGGEDYYNNVIAPYLQGPFDNWDFSD